MSLSLPPGLVRIACIAALYAAMLSGRFSFVRFFADAARADWLQLRILFTVLAALGWLLLRKERAAPLGAGRTSWVWLGGLGVFYAYLLGNTMLLGDPALAPQYVLDLAITALQAFLAIQIIRSATDLDWFARFAAATGIVLFVFSLAGFGNPDVNGAGWAPFGGPVTFYRLEFLTFCCALYLFARSRGGFALLYLLVGAVGLFCALASLSKVAFAGTLVALAFMLFWLLAARRSRQAAIIGLTAGAVISLFVYVRGELFIARMGEISAPLASEILGYELSDRDLLGAEMTPGNRNWTVGHLRRIERGEKLTLADLPAWQQRYIRAFVTRANPEQIPLASVLESLSRLMIFGDSTGRARLWLHAADLFRFRPVFGVGMGNYRFEQMNRYTKEIEVYRHPHNIVLELGAVTGMVGLLAFLGLVFATLVMLQRCVMARPALLPLMGYAVFVFVTSLASGDYFDFRLFWLVGVITVFAAEGDLAGEATASPRGTIAPQSRV